MQEFLSRHASQISGVLRGPDRLIVRGYLQMLSTAAGMVSFLNRVQVIDGGAAQVRSAVRVDDDRDALQLQLHITLGRAGVEAEAVLKAGAAAALDRNTKDERLRIVFLRHELFDLRRRYRREGDQGVSRMLDGCHGLIVADGVRDTSYEFVTLVSLILCGVSDPFVRPKGEC